MSVTKADITNNIKNNLKLNSLDSKLFINIFFKIIKENAFKKKVKISKFGTFKVHISKKRVGRNPKSMQTFLIKSRKKIKLDISSHLKQGLLNWTITKLVYIF